MAFTSQSAHSSGTAGSMTISLPSAPAAGDVLIMYVQAYRSATAINIPAGWSVIGSKLSGGQDIYKCAVRVADGTEGKDFAVSTNTAFGLDGGIIAFTGINHWTPVHKSAFTSGTSVVSCPSVTPTEDDCIILRFGGIEQPYTWSTWSDGSTKVWSGGTGATDPSKCSSVAGQNTQTTAAATGTAAISATSNSYTTGATLAISTNTTDPDISMNLAEAYLEALVSNGPPNMQLAEAYVEALVSNGPPNMHVAEAYVEALVSNGPPVFELAEAYVEVLVSRRVRRTPIIDIEEVNE